MRCARCLSADTRIIGYGHREYNDGSIVWYDIMKCQDCKHEWREVR